MHLLLQTEGAGAPVNEASWATQKGFDLTRRNRTIAYGASLAVLCTLVWVGYRLAYAEFQSYDDEGYLLITVRQFLNGVPLYDGVYTQYGPAYYLWQEILHRGLDVPLTHDATRLVTLTIWLAVSTLIGVVVWLLLKRGLMAGVAVLFAFLHLRPLTFEPGHPQELCLLSVMSVIVIVMWRVLRYGRVGAASAALIGALVAITALTKVNVGAFLVFAMALTLVSSVRGFWGSRGIVVATVLTVLVATLIPLRNHLFRADVAAFAIVIWSGLFASFVGDRKASCHKGLVTIRELAACAAGMSIASIIIVSAVLQDGTSLSALFGALFVSPLGFSAAVFWTRMPVPPAAAALSILWLIAAGGLRRNRQSTRRWMLYVNVTMARVVCLLSMTNWFNPLLAIGTPFASTVLADSSLEPRQRAARRILAFAAMLLALQAYPVPGTQVALGTLLLLPVALVVLPQAEQELAQSRSTSKGPRFAGAAPVLGAVAVLGLFTVPSIQQSLSSGIPLQMAGAQKVRAPEADAAAYHWLAANLREHCDRFLTAPGFNSLHFWTGIPPVSSLNTTVWPVLLDDTQQQQIVDAATPVARLCVIWSAPQMAHLLTGPGTASRPLVEFIEREVDTSAAFGEWEFRVRRGRQLTLLHQAQWIDQGGLVLDLPALGDQRVKRIQVVDLEARATLADTADTKDVAVFEEGTVRVERLQGVDLSRPRRLVIRGAARPSSAEHGIVVRLWGEEDRVIETLPLVTPAKPAR
jgi:hypothetical protein